jgi:ferritin
MLSPKIQDALNAQINAEYLSALTYLSLTAYFEDTDFKGFSHWMRIQYKEELTHAEKLFDFINERDGRVHLTQLEAPRLEWESPLAGFQSALDNERSLSAKINDIVSLALDEKDFATHSFMQWFINEQVEEESLVNDIVQDLRRIGDNSNGLFLMDRDLAQRQPDTTAGAEGGTA